MAYSSFGLLAEDWVPVRVGGRRELVGLRELFLRAHEFSDVEVGLPPAASGFWRVLYVLAARVTGLDDPELLGHEWHDERAAVLGEGRFDADAVNDYFDRYADRFDLFHPERPWLQDPRLLEECGKASGINKLILGRPAGNSQVWFGHHSDTDPRPVPSAEAVWALLAQLFYGPSGRCTSRTVGSTSEANSTAGPLRSTVSFQPLGENVFESLLAGLPLPEETEAEMPGEAPWESAELPNPLAVPKVADGVASLVSRLRHAVLLTPGPHGRTVVDARMTWAWRQPHGDVEDPYLIYQTSKQGRKYARPADADRAVFRDLDALLCKSSGDPGVFRPLIMDGVQQLPIELLERLRVRAFGFDQDGQTRDRQWFTATTPPVLDLIEKHDPAAAAAISRWRRAADLCGRNLAWALRRAWVAINDPSNGDGMPNRKDLGDGPWRGRGAAWYWPGAERVFWGLVHDRDFTAGDKAFYGEAVRAFDRVTAPHAHRPRAARAIERSRGLIFSGRPSPASAS